MVCKQSISGSTCLSWKGVYAIVNNTNELQSTLFMMEKVYLELWNLSQAKLDGRRYHES